MAKVDLQKLLDMLDGVKRSSGDGQYMAKCPIHNDKKASLAVRLGDTGKIVLHCLAGCESEDIVARLGLSMADLAPDTADSPRAKSGSKTATATKDPPGVTTVKKKEPPTPLPHYMKVGGYYEVYDKDKTTKKKVLVRKEKITKEYIYQDAKGQPAIKVFRTEKKSFPVGFYTEGQWCWGDGGHTAMLYRLPRVLETAKKKEMVIIVEGEKDVETLEALGYCGTTNKGGANKWGKESTAALKGARVVIIPDIDDPGRKHGRMIAKEIRNTAEEVRIVDLRNAGIEQSEKCDVSEIVERVGAEQGKAILDHLIRTAPVIYKQVDDSAYAEYFDYVPGCKVEQGRILAPYKQAYIPLCDFVALPIEETILDDGVETKIRLRIAGWNASGRRMQDAIVMVEEFSGMGWVAKNWGLSACIEPGTSTKDKLRAIIQKAGNRNAVRKTVYAHTGWRVIQGRPVFLHGAGAIGMEGVGVELAYELGELYDLSGLKDGVMDDNDMEARRRAALSVSMECIDIAGPRIGVPLVGFMYLAPLTHFLREEGVQPAFIPFVSGTTGGGKSSIASLIMHHFGRRFTLQKNPASFHDTANGISLKLHAMKDMPLLIDDYHPTGDPKRKTQMDNTAQQIARMIGDGATRSRMRSDATGQQDKPARGLVLETGEQLPDVKSSGQARLYVIETKPGSVPVGSDEMNALQEKAKEGYLSESMRGYIEWLIPQYARLPEQLSKRYSELRKEATRRSAETHKRLPSSVAHLMLGLEMMLKYGQSLGMINDGLLDLLMEDYWQAVLENSDQQSREMADEKPSKIYIETLRELLLSKQGFVYELDQAGGSSHTVPGCLGFRDELYYYFVPGAAYAAVQKACVSQGSNFPLGKISIAKALREEGLLLPDQKAEKNVRQVKRNGVHGWFQWIPRHIIDGTAPPAQQIEFSPVDDDKDNPFAKGGCGDG